MIFTKSACENRRSIYGLNPGCHGSAVVNLDTRPVASLPPPGGLMDAMKSTSSPVSGTFTNSDVASGVLARLETKYDLPT